MISPEHLQHTVVVYGSSSFDSAGKQTLATGVNVKTFFRRKSRRLTNSNGDTYVSDAYFYCMPSVNIEENDQVTFRGGTYQVMAVDHADDPDFDVYTKVSLQRKS